MASLIGALASNTSLVNLSLHGTRVSVENCIVLCRPLARHPKLKLLPKGRVARAPYLRGRTHTILNMLQANTVLEKLCLTHGKHETRVLKDVIEPCMRCLPDIHILNDALNECRGPMRALLLEGAAHGQRQPRACVEAPSGQSRHVGGLGLTKPNVPPVEMSSGSVGGSERRRMCENV
jgi:hypothetical protein